MSSRRRGASGLLAMLLVACSGGPSMDTGSGDSGSRGDGGADDASTDAPPPLDASPDTGDDDLGAPPSPFTYLKAFNAGELDAFGEALALDGDTLVVAAPREDAEVTGVYAASELPQTPPFEGIGFDDRAFDAGAVYVYRRGDDGGWALEAYLKASNAQAEDRFGSAVALRGDLLAVGALLEDGPDDTLGDAGAVYLFEREGTTWRERSVLRASNAGAFDHFGEALAFSDAGLLVGAPLVDGGGLGVDARDEGDGNDRGAAYLFAATSGGGEERWEQVTTFRSTEGGGGFFGAAVAMDGDQIALGADTDNPFQRGSGRVHLFRRSPEDGVWAPDGIVQAAFGGRFDRFGDRVGLRDGVLLVSAPNEDSAAREIDGNEEDNERRNSGAGYVFERSDDGWVRVAYLKAPNADADDNFGQGLFVGAGELFVLAPGEDGASLGPMLEPIPEDNDLSNTGAAYRFTPRGGGWAPAELFKALNPGIDDRLGAVAATAELLAFGAPGEDGGLRAVLGDDQDDRGVDAGAVYVYARDALR
ncbi:MAG: FG-GAP repeat protein [Myxococcota bacterium]